MLIEKESANIFIDYQLEIGGTKTANVVLHLRYNK